MRPIPLARPRSPSTGPHGKACGSDEIEPFDSASTCLLLSLLASIEAPEVRAADSAIEAP